MSVVSGITLHIHCGEDYIEQEDGTDLFQLVEKINGWLVHRGFARLEQVDKYYGGGKHPQVCVFGAGYNGFCHLEDEFANYVAALPWLNPENAVLLIEPEDGPVKIIRPIVNA